MAKRYNFVADIPSSSNPDKLYRIKMDEIGNLTCNCPIWIYNRRGNRTCKHTDIVQNSGFLNGTAKLFIINGRWGNKSPFVCNNYPDKCDDCEIRFKCYTETNPELSNEEYMRMKH